MTVRAYFNLADAYDALHNPREALINIKKARDIDPTNPYLLVWQARYLYDVGDVIGSTRLLKNFLATTPRPVRSRRCFITASALLQQDPLLAYSVHYSSDRL